MTTNGPILRRRWAERVFTPKRLEYLDKYLNPPSTLEERQTTAWRKRSNARHALWKTLCDTYPRAVNVSRCNPEKKSAGALLGAYDLVTFVGKWMIVLNTKL